MLGLSGAFRRTHISGVYGAACWAQTRRQTDRFLWGGVERLQLRVGRVWGGVKPPLDGLAALEQHSPYTRERCATQWCCQRNQTPFLLRWRRSKSYHHRPPGCPWAGSPVCRQSRQRQGLRGDEEKKKQQEQYSYVTVRGSQASGDRHPYSLRHQHTKWKVLQRQGLAGKHPYIST